MTKAKLKFTPYRRPGNRTHKVTGSWSYTVSADVQGERRVVMSDNTGGTASNIPKHLFDQAAFDAAVAQRMVSSGHKFQLSWDEVVDNA